MNSIIYFDVFNDWISRDGICVGFINCILFGRDFRSSLQTELYRIFNRFFGVRLFLKSLVKLLGVDILVFQTDCDIVMSYGFLVRFRETETHSKTCGGCHVLIFGQGVT